MPTIHIIEYLFKYKLILNINYFLIKIVLLAQSKNSNFKILELGVRKCLT